MSKLILPCILVLIANAAAIQWPDFRVTFGLNPAFSSWDFAILPRDVASAVADSNGAWSAANAYDCTNGGKFNGIRANQGNDYTMSLLFDINGIIAGIQMNLLKSQVPNTSFQYGSVPMFQSDSLGGNDVYTLTVYFTDPSTICTTGRTEADLTNVGTITQLWLQNGPSPSNSIPVPNDRATAIAQGWSKNNCFVGMGRHNFYQSEQFQATNCQQIRPIFLLFDTSDTLIGFGFAAVGNFVSNRYEHPDAKAIKLIVGDGVAQCLLDDSTSPGLSTMHVYFDSKPYLFACV